ncbi:4-methylaminobutanoate oxidase (formaldehyde-forming) [Dongia mobilis]|uniref:4-methylaminobutanoate oxidase (Formaldehyde-forming) n=1 Tax=Dongia mobilis TaxID=578943 RepID=A0A4R6WIU8_9PROT|nr:FAD-binding oxidoreductase [Dongia mobilis]TDQ78420.1 4-methylaminobutanoate oxidase (formaldehyde-forming) [Dongia mobilis]
MPGDTERIDRAQVVIIGGGVVGCSIAYHLTRLGVTDVLLLERNELASGATARSAGCVLHVRSDLSTTQMVSRTCAAMAELEELLGESLDFRQVGCIRAVFSEEREHEFVGMVRVLAEAGIPAESLDPPAAREICPWLELKASRRIIYVSADGYIDGARLNAAYARAARMLGARIRRGVSVSAILSESGRAVGVRTDQGTVEADWVVDAAGAWGVEVASWAGWGLPAASTRSHYWITAPDGSGSETCPVVQLPDMRTYLRPEVGGLLIGMQEPRSLTYDPLQITSDMAEMPLSNHTDDLDLLLEQSGALRTVVPTIDSWRFAHHIAGLSTYTPDGKFLIGPVPSLSNFLVAGGCCGSGVAASGGFGLSIAELINGSPMTIDIERYRPDRFGDVDPSSQDFRDRCAAARSSKSRG